MHKITLKSVTIDVLFIYSKRYVEWVSESTVAVYRCHNIRFL
jgi:hypothetical protein